MIALLLFPGGLFVLAQWAGATNGSTANWWRACKTGSGRAGSNRWPTRSSCWRKKRSCQRGWTRACSSALPVVALAGALTAALYVPLAGCAPAFSFPGDLIVTVYLLSLLTLCLGLAGANTTDRFSLMGRRAR